MTARRLAMTLLGLAVVGAVALAAGPRSGLLVAIGIGFGLVLEGLRFGFAGPWRLMIAERDARAVNAVRISVNGQMSLERFTGAMERIARRLDRPPEHAGV